MSRSNSCWGDVLSRVSSRRQSAAARGGRCNAWKRSGRDRRWRRRPSRSRTVAALMRVTRPASESPRRSQGRVRRPEPERWSRSWRRRSSGRSQRRRRLSGIKALDLVETSLTQSPSHTGQVGGPAVHATGLGAIEISFSDLVRSHVGDVPDLGVFARRAMKCGAAERSARHQASVVIGVLTDQVHTARKGSPRPQAQRRNCPQTAWWLARRPLHGSAAQ